MLKSADWYNRTVTDLLEPYGLSHEQFNVLKILEAAHPKPMKLKQIQAKLLNQTANTTRLVEKLKQKGLLEKKPSPTSGREVAISITDAGKELLDSTVEDFVDLDGRLKKKMTSEEAVLLTKLLNKVRS